MSAEFWLSIAGMVFGIGVVGGVFVFGRNIYWSRWRDESWFAHLFHAAGNNLGAYQEAMQEYLDRRNKFWEMFGQVTLAMVVVVLLTVLLLMGKIEAEAGLPILSAIVAFVVGKGIGGRDRWGNTGGPDD